MKHHAPNVVAWVSFLISLLIMLNGINVVHAKLIFTGITPTWVNSTQSLPYLHCMHVPDDPDALVSFETFHYINQETNQHEWYELEIPRVYIEYNIEMKGIVASDVMRLDATTYSVDTLGLELDQVISPDIQESQINGPASGGGGSNQPFALNRRESTMGSPLQDIALRKRKWSMMRRNSTDYLYDTHKNRRLLEDAAGCEALEGDSYGDKANAARAMCDRARKLKQESEATAAKLRDLQDRVSQLTNWFLSFGEGLVSANATLAELEHAIEIAILKHRATGNSSEAMLALLLKAKDEALSANVQINSTRAAYDLLTETMRDDNLLLRGVLAELARNQAGAYVMQAQEAFFLNNTYEVLTQMLITGNAHLLYLTQEIAMSNSITQHMVQIAKQFMRNDQTRSNEIRQQNAMFRAAESRGWRPWVYHFGKAPYDHLPTSAQVETLGYLDHYWVNNNILYRDHISLMCDTENMIIHLTGSSVETFLDLFELFSTRPCQGGACDCRIRRIRHKSIVSGDNMRNNDFSSLTTQKQRDYATRMRTWMMFGEWNTELIFNETVPIPVFHNCSSIDYQSTIDPYFCPQVLSRDFATPIYFTPVNHTSAGVAHSARLAMSAAKKSTSGMWEWVELPESEQWISTLSEFENFISQSCLKTMGTFFPFIRTTAFNIFPMSFEMPETPESRTYCRTSLDSIVGAISIGRPFVYFTFDFMVRFVNGWKSLRMTALQSLLDGYAASPQFMETQPFEYQMTQNNTVPAIVQKRTMYAAATTISAGPVYALTNRNEVRSWTVRRLAHTLSSPPNTENERSTYDPSFTPIRLDNTVVTSSDSVSGLDVFPFTMKWVGYPACMGKSCPMFVHDMIPDEKHPTLFGTVTSENAQNGMHPYVLDVDDSLLVTSTHTISAAHSATYTYIPIQSTGLDDTMLGVKRFPMQHGSNASTRAHPYPVDGIERSYFAPSLAAWTRLHQGDMDPRDVGVGIASYRVFTYNMSTSPANQFNILCSPYRPSTSTKCDLMDVAFMDFDVERGTARWYARRLQMTAPIPMLSHGTVRLPARTTCPESISVKLTPLSTSSLYMTLHQTHAQQYVYVFATRCDAVKDSGWTSYGAVGENQSWLEWLLAQATSKAMFQTPMSIEEHSMDTWIPYATQTFALSGCNQQNVNIYASKRSLTSQVMDIIQQFYVPTPNVTLAALQTYLLAVPRTNNNNMDSRVWQTIEQMVQLVLPTLLDSVTTVVSGPVPAAQQNAAFNLVASTETQRCHSLRVPTTDINVQSIRQNVMTGIQYQRDGLSDLIRSTLSQQALLQSLQFDSIAKVLNAVFDIADTNRMLDMIEDLEAILRQFAEEIERLQRGALDANNNYEVNRLRQEAFREAIKKQLIPPEVLDASLADARRLRDLIASMQARSEEELAAFRLAAKEFSDALEKMQRDSTMFRAFDGTSFDLMTAHGDRGAFFRMFQRADNGCPYPPTYDDDWTAINDHKSLTPLWNYITFGFANGQWSGLKFFIYTCLVCIITYFKTYKRIVAEVAGTVYPVAWWVYFAATTIFFPLFLAYWAAEAVWYMGVATPKKNTVSPQPPPAQQQMIRP